MLRSDVSAQGVPDWRPAAFDFPRITRITLVRELCESPVNQFYNGIVCKSFVSEGIREKH